MELKESKAVVFLGIALYAAVVGAVGVTAPDPDIVAAVKEDIGHVIRPGGVNGSPFWNGNAVMFMYPPSFDFPELKEADHGYRFEVVDAHGRMHAFEASSPKVPLTNVWDSVPAGFTTVTSVFPEHKKNLLIRLLSDQEVCVFYVEEKSKTSRSLSLVHRIHPLVALYSSFPLPPLKSMMGVSLPCSSNSNSVLTQLS